MKNTLISAIAMIAFSLSSVHASSINWNLVGSSSQLLGTSDTLVSTTGNIDLTFSGYLTTTGDVATSNSWLAPTAESTDLFSKDGGGDEKGLGIAADPSGDHEIIKNSFIQLDVRALLSNNITSLNLVIGSVQTGEGFKVWGSNTAAQPGTLLYTGTSTMDDVTFSVPDFGSYNYISVSASANNVLLDSVTSVTSGSQLSATPEPRTASLICVAALGFFLKKLAQRPNRRTCR